jgi:4'-phosphopantetheinyl transferase EntD
MFVFVAKEAFYKCQHPLTEEFLDFDEVEIALDVGAGRFAITAITRPGYDWAHVRQARGRIRSWDGLLLAGATLAVRRQLQAGR